MGTTPFYGHPVAEEDLFETKILRFLMRHHIEAMALLYLLPMAWLGLVPFDFGAYSPESGTSSVWWGLSNNPTPLFDKASNIALYVPLGLLFRASAIRIGFGRLGSAVAAIFFAATISYLTEWTQLFSPSRICSAVDFKCNMIGAAIGIASYSAGRFVGNVVAEAARSIGRSIVTRVQLEILERPSEFAAQVCACVLFLSAIAPWDVTFSFNRLRQSVGNTNLVPFAREVQLSSPVLPGPGEDNPRREFIRSRERWQLRFDHCWWTAGFGLLGALTAQYLLVHCGITGFRRIVWTTTACGFLALFSSGAQFFIISRTVDITDVILGVFGAFCGACASLTLVGMWMDTENGGRRRLLGTLLAGWCLMIIARELAPFQFVTSPDSVAQQIARTEWMPAAIYQRARLPVAVDDLVNKVGRYVLLATLVALWRSSQGKPIITQNPFWLAVQASVVVAILESMQVFLPSRVPSLTDVLIAGAGVAVGMAGYRLVVAGFLLIEVAWTKFVRVSYDVEFGDVHAAPIEPGVSLYVDANGDTLDKGDSGPGY